jgi:molybdopterin-guanine dinucleotide biosynthesis protein A
VSGAGRAPAGGSRGTPGATPAGMTDILGVITAGGASSRYGTPKALAEVGGRRVVDRAADALRAALDCEDVVAIINDPGLAHAVGLPHRGDVLRGIGPAGRRACCAAVGAWSGTTAGVLIVGCDMPFLEPALLRELGSPCSHGADAVVPESEGRRGIEPLCAYYGTACIAAIEAAVASRNDHSHDRLSWRVCVDQQVAAGERVRRFGDPARIFLNVNTPDDRADGGPAAGG